jgi:hypothetical protein
MRRGEANREAPARAEPRPTAPASMPPRKEPRPSPSGRPTGAKHLRTLGCEPGVAAQVEKRGKKENAGHRYAGPAPYHATHRAEGERITRERLMNQRQETDR